MKDKLDETFFGINQNLPLNIRKKFIAATWDSITQGDRVVSFESVRNTLGIDLTPDQYQKIKNTFQGISKKYGKTGEIPVTVRVFMNRFKKGSRPFRKIISHSRLTVPGGAGGGGGESASVKKILRLIDCEPPAEVRVKSLFYTWNKQYHESRMRIFKFKYYNNLLGLNSRVAHFNMTVTEECTFCNLAGPRPAVSETFIHLFYHCNHVQNLLQKMIKKIR
jgi:hypothetical protein